MNTQEHFASFNRWKTATLLSIAVTFFVLVTLQGWNYYKIYTLSAQLTAQSTPPIDTAPKQKESLLQELCSLTQQDPFQTLCAELVRELPASVKIFSIDYTSAKDSTIVLSARTLDPLTTFVHACSTCTRLRDYKLVATEQISPQEYRCTIKKTVDGEHANT